MNRKKAASKILFFIYTYLIANSAFFALGLVYIESFSISYCWKKVKIFILQWNIIRDFFDMQWFHPIKLIVILIFCYEALILFYPVRLWWRKRTIYHAWLVAMTGLLLPNYLALFLSTGLKFPQIIYSAGFVTTAGYAAAWMIGYGIRQFRTISWINKDADDT